MGGKREYREIERWKIMPWVNLLFPNVWRKSLSLSIFTDLNPNLYGHTLISKSLENLHKKVTNIMLIYSYPSKLEIQRELSDVVNKNLEFLVQSNRIVALPEELRGNTANFIVSDESYQIEDFHDPWWNRQNRNEEPAGLLYLYEDHAIKEHLSKIFERFLKKAKPHKYLLSPEYAI